MAFWRGETLEKRLPSLIAPYDAKQIDINAYTLRMGSEYYSTSDRRRAWYPQTVKKLSQNQSFVIPPGQFAFLLTAEEVTIPDDAMAFISIKARIKFEGLINVSGFHVDPGYKGHLVFSVYNAGSSAITLYQGQSLFLIWYAALDEKTEILKDPSQSKTISRELLKGISPETLSIQSLSDEIVKFRSRLNLLTTLFSVAAAVVVAVIVGVTNDAVHDFLHPPHAPASATPVEPVAPTEQSPTPGKPAGPTKQSHTRLITPSDESRH